MNELDVTRTIGTYAASGPEDADIRSAVRGALNDVITGQSRPGGRVRGWTGRLAGAAAVGVCAAVVVTLFVVSNKSGPSPAGPGVPVYKAIGTVLERQPGGDGLGSPHGPQLCVGPIRTSLPPQCGGPDIVGWDWNAVPGTVSAAGTTKWGEYLVVGTFDGDRLTLTEPPRTPTDEDQAEAADPPAISDTPCTEPPGGWLPLSPAADSALKGALDYITRSPDQSAFWFARSGQERWSVLNVRFARNAVSHEAKLRALHPGNLCVTEGGRPQSELEAIRDELFLSPGLLLDSIGKPLKTPGVLTGGVDAPRGIVAVQVILDTGDLQRTVDERYGPGVVKITSALKPVG